MSLRLFEMFDTIVLQTTNPKTLYQLSNPNPNCFSLFKISWHTLKKDDGMAQAVRRIWECLICLKPFVFINQTKTTIDEEEEKKKTFPLLGRCGGEKDEKMCDWKFDFRVCVKVLFRFPYLSLLLSSIIISPLNSKTSSHLNCRTTFYLHKVWFSP